MHDRTLNATRRPIFRTRSGPLAAILLTILAALPVIAEDWPGHLGSRRSGNYQGGDLLAAFPAAGPKKIWSLEIGEGFSAPVISGDKLILFHRRNNQDLLQCFEASTGKQLWQLATETDYKDSFGRGDGPRSTPAIHDGRVFTYSAAGLIQAADLASGKKLWAIDAVKELAARKGFFGHAASPLAEGKLLILNVGGRNGGGVVALDQTSGQTVWKATDDEAGYSSPVAATIDGRRIILVLTRAGLRGLEPLTGKPLFFHPFRSRIDASVNAATPLIHENEIFLSASYGAGAALLRLNGDQPAKIWAADEILSNHYASSVLHNGHLFGLDGRQEEGTRLRCVEWKTGKLLWTQEDVTGSVTCADGKLLILSEDGELTLAAADPAGFGLISRAKILEGNCRAYPAIAGGLFFARDDSKLICIDLRK